jgi:hypothetical protein
VLLDAIFEEVASSVIFRLFGRELHMLFKLPIHLLFQQEMALPYDPVLWETPDIDKNLDCRHAVVTEEE